MRVDRDPLGPARAGRVLVGLRIRDEGRHPAGRRVADVDAAQPSLVAARVRLGVRRVEDILLVDEQPARPSELVPRLEVVPLLVEDLHAAVAAVADEEASLRVHGERVRVAELPVRRARASPLQEEGAVGRELHDAVVAARVVPVRHEDAAVGRDEDVRRLVEVVRAVPRHALLAQHHQDLALGAELVDDVSPAIRHGRVSHRVGHPHGAVLLHEHPVRPRDESRAEAAHDVPLGVEEQDGVDVALDAQVRAAALAHPDVLAVRGRVDGAGRAPRTSVGKLPPAVHGPVRVRRRQLRLERAGARNGRREREYRAESHSPEAMHPVLL